MQIFQIIESDHSFFYLADEAASELPMDVDGYNVDHDGSVEFFDADQNALFPVSPIGELRDEIEWAQLEVEASVEAEEGRDQDPYRVHGVSRNDFARAH